MRRSKGDLRVDDNREWYSTAEFYNFDVAVSAVGFIAAAKVLVRVGLYGGRSLFAK